MVLRKARVPLAILMGSAALALIMRGPAEALLREPLAFLWWLIDSLPQQLIWSMLTIIGFLMVFSLARGPRHERPYSPVAPTPHETETQRLTQLILLAENSDWAREVMGRRLSETAAALRALREREQRGRVRDEILTGCWPADRSVSEVQPRQPENRGRYAREVAQSLDSLERYAREGEL